MKKIPWDKRAHFIAMMWGTFLAALLSMNAWAAVGIALIVSVGKEIIDHYTGGVASWGDMAANLAGILVGIMLFLAFEKLVRSVDNHDKR